MRLEDSPISIIATDDERAQLLVPPEFVRSLIKHLLNDGVACEEAPYPVEIHQLNRRTGTQAVSQTHGRFSSITVRCSATRCAEKAGAWMRTLQDPPTAQP